MGAIRLLLAISVILSHSGSIAIFGKMVVGPTAVQFFFILSGFYMALVLNGKYTAAAPFYRNRLSRIFSGYWICLAIAVVIGAITNHEIYSSILSEQWDFWSKALMLGSNTLIFGSTFMMFSYPTSEGIALTSDFGAHADQFYKFHYLPQAWSLPVELIFYGLAPFVVRSTKMIAAVAVVSLAVRLATYWLFGAHDPWTYRFPPSEMVLFMMGAMAFHMMRQISFDQSRIPSCVLTATIAIILGFDYLPAVLTWPILCAFSLAIAAIFPLTSGWKADRFAGEISYSVYLIHWPLIGLQQWLTGDVSPMLTVVTSVALAVPIHLLAHRLDNFLRGQPAGRI